MKYVAETSASQDKEIKIGLAKKYILLSSGLQLCGLTHFYFSLVLI